MCCLISLALSLMSALHSRSHKIKLAVSLGWETLTSNRNLYNIRWPNLSYKWFNHTSNGNICAQLLHFHFHNLDRCMEISHNPLSCYILDNSHICNHWQLRTWLLWHQLHKHIPSRQIFKTFNIIVFIHHS